jgi:ACS family hexuronate transporter-like MFS transporter
VLSRRAAWAITIAATATMMISYVDRATLAVLAPSVTLDLDISDEQFGWLLSAFSMAYLIGTPLAGWWIDRVGARRGLVVSLALWSTVAALQSIVPGLWTLFALRLALGIAEGPGFPGAAQAVNRVLPPESSSRGYGVLFTGSSIGGLLAPIAAAALYRAAGWRVAFLTTAAAGLVWIPAWILVTRSAPAKAALDRRATADAGPRPKLVELLRDPRMIRALVAVFAAAPLVGFAQGFGAKYLKLTFGVAQGDVGGYLWLPPLFFDLGAIGFGDLAARYRRMTAPFYAISLVLATAMALLPVAATPWQSMLFASLSLAGAGGLYTLTTSELLSRMPPGSVAFAGGVLAGAQSLSLIIMSPIVGAQVEATQSYTQSALMLGLWVIPGALAWLLWPRAMKPA